MEFVPVELPFAVGAIVALPLAPGRGAGVEGVLGGTVGGVLLAAPLAAPQNALAKPRPEAASAELQLSLKHCVKAVVNTAEFAQ